VTYTLDYEGGTIRVEAAEGSDLDAIPFVEADARSLTGRAPAFRYADRPIAPSRAPPEPFRARRRSCPNGAAGCG